MTRATLTDIAIAAGLSLATVDRVMNNRPGVSERSRNRVIAVARQLGFDPPADAALRPVRLAFVLPDGTNTFVHDLADQVARQSPAFPGVTARVEHVRGFDPGALAQRLQALTGQVDGLAMLALDHPVVREAARQLIARGVALATIASDVRAVGHLGYIGIDDAQAGRLAGYLMGRLMGPGPGQVAVFSGSLAYRGHHEREMGFRQVLAEDFPNLEIVAQGEVQDSRATARAAMNDVLAAWPGLAGHYNAGGGTAGVAAALEDAGRAGQVVLIAHDLTAGNKALLLRKTLDAVIDQNARVEIREALNTLTNAVRGTPYAMVPPRLQVIFRENLPND